MNIIEVRTLFDLKQIVSSNETVIVGFTLPDTDIKMKIAIRKFLKRKSESFPLIKFVYMEVSEENRNKLSILDGTDEEYPKLYHIRDGNKILVSVISANEQTIHESFDAVEKYYIREMQEYQKRDNKQETEIDTTSEKAKNVENVNRNIENNKNQIDEKMEKKIMLEKLVLLNKKSDDLKLEMVKEIAKRKKVEAILNEQKKEKEKKEMDPVKYRKSLRRKGN